MLFLRAILLLKREVAHAVTANLALNNFDTSGKVRKCSFQWLEKYTVFKIKLGSSFCHTGSEMIGEKAMRMALTFYEETSGSPYRVGVVLPSFQLSLRYGQPVKLEVPLEGPHDVT